MAGQDETLRLAAEVVDRWSGPMRSMQKALRELADVAKGANVTNTAHVRDQAKAYVGLDRSVRDIAVRTKSMLTPALAAAGVSILSVGAAVAAMVKSTKDFGAATEKLVRLGRETGLAVTKLRELDALASGIGSSPEAMNAGLAAFAKKMEEYRRGVGTLAEFVISQHDVGIKAAAEAIRATTDNSRAFDMVIDELDHIQSKTGRLADTMAMRENWLEAFSIVKEFANLSGDELRKLKTENDEALGKLPPGWKERGTALARSMFLLKTSIKGTADLIGAELAPNFTRAADAARLLVEQNRGPLLNDMKILAADAEAIAKGLSAAGGWLDKMGDSPGLHKFLKGTVGALVGPRAAEQLYPGSSMTFKERAAGIPEFASGGVVTKDMLAMVHRNEIIVPAGGGLGADEALKRPVREGTAEGTRRGVLEGLRDWYESSYGGGAAGGGPGGGIGGGMGGRGGPPGGAGAGAPSGHGAGYGVGGAVSVPPGTGGGMGAGAFDRSRFAEELKNNPRLKEEFFRHAAGEDSPGSPSGTLANQAIMESAMNRAAMRGTSLAAQLGYFQGYRSFNANQRAIMEDNLNKVLGGSDVSGGATDNSSGGLAARERASGKFRFIKEINRESFFSPGWGEPNWQRRYPLFLA
ncbi:MAG: hypothetical protein ACLPTZ_25165, partial [Beijerinckiaceae bacterium]